MKALTWLGMAAAVLVLGAAARAQDKDYAKMVVGKWEVSKADEGTVPVGTQIEFTKDGKMKVAGKKDDADLKLEGTYKVVKDKLTFTMKLGDAEKSQTITITKISDKEMSTKSEEGKAVDLKKQ
jgi:uncharacterized protein (TIGR03066 family)